MKLHGILDEQSALALDAPWFIAELEPAGDYGRSVFAELCAFVPGEETLAQDRAQRVAAFGARMGQARLELLREILHTMPDARHAVATAAMGDLPDDAAFLELLRFCDGAKQIDAHLGDVDVEPCADDAVRTLGADLERGRCGRRGFYLDDAFDPQLAEARVRLDETAAEFEAARGRLAGAVARQLGRDEPAWGEFILMRGDLLGGVPSHVRVVREAPTYYLCELELDEASRAALQRRDEAAQTVAALEYAVRAKLAGRVGERAGALAAAMRRLGELDVLVAAARFAVRYRCTVPAIVDRGCIDCVGARYLPLAAELERVGASYVPIDVRLTGVAVVTGPNMGGKSAGLRTCGTIALCAAFGLPVPATRATVGLFDRIAWLGIGVQADRGGLLSSFAGEVVRLRDLLEDEQRRMFLLIDEFARTTTPHEGQALLVAVIGRLRQRGICALVATHLSGVARAAGVAHLAVRGLRTVPSRPLNGDLAAALEALAAAMDYTLLEVGADDPGQTDALALARLLGLDDELVAAASAALCDSAAKAPVHQARSHVDQ